MRPQPSFKEALSLLARNEVAFVVVGGVAAVLGGAPISTFDLDIVHDRTPTNVDKLVIALRELDARYRDPAGRVILPEASSLLGEGHHLLLTRCGPLDVLGRLSGGWEYSDLVSECTVRSIGTWTVQVLGLAALIRTKRDAGRDKDRAVLALLQRTLEESSR